MADSVRVVCRFRPQNSIETSHGGKVCIDVEGDDKSVNLEMNGGDTRHAFTFDKVFGMAASQQEVYAYSVGHIVDDVLGGYNGTVFAYGQTSAGKVRPRHRRALPPALTVSARAAAATDAHDDGLRH